MTCAWSSSNYWSQEDLEPLLSNSQPSHFFTRTQNHIFKLLFILFMKNIFLLLYCFTSLLLILCFSFQKIAWHSYGLTSMSSLPFLHLFSYLTWKSHEIVLLDPAVFLFKSPPCYITQSSCCINIIHYVPALPSCSYL